MVVFFVVYWLIVGCVGDCGFDWLLWNFLWGVGCGCGWCVWLFDEYGWWVILKGWGDGVLGVCWFGVMCVDVYGIFR